MPSWHAEHRPTRLDEAKKAFFEAIPDGTVDLRPAGDLLPGDWWRLEEEGKVVGYGWMDVTWGDAQILLAVAPDREAASRLWPGDLPRVAQGHGDLGQRMLRLLQLPPRGPVCLIGSDIPGVTPAHIAHAFALLGNHDAVFAPAMDGGFWLVGAKHPNRLPRDLFRGARWSSEHALADSLTTLPGRRVGLADLLSDVDCAADLRRQAVLRRGKQIGKMTHLPGSRASG